MANNDININLNGKYKAKSAFKEAERDMDSLGKKADQTSKKMKDADRSTGAFGSSSANASNKFKQLGSSIGVFNKNIGSSVSKLGAAQGATAGLVGMLGGPLVAAAAIAATAIAAFGAMSYQKAVQSQAEWAKFKGIVEAQGQSFENSKAIVKDFAYTSGTAVAEVRTAFSQLTAAGINPSGEALRGVKEMAIGLRTDMTSAATAYTRIVKGGAGATRTLSKLGITMEEISTGGKVDTAKLNAVLEQKFGKAADNFANSSQAAGIRLQTAIDGMMVAFGSVLLPFGTMLQNNLAFVISGLTKFGGMVYNLFGGADAFSGALDYITPALDELWKALSELYPDTTGLGDQFGMLKPILTGLGWVLAQFVRSITMTIQIAIKLRDGIVWAYNALRGFASAIWNLPGTIRGYLVSAGQSIYNAARNFPGWIYSTIVNAIPRIQWPNPGDIANWIRNMIWGSRGPGGIASIGSQIAKQSALRASNLAAQRASLTAAYQSSPAAQQAASQAKSNMGIFGSLSSFFGPGDWQDRIAGMSFQYQNYGGTRQKAWNGGDCMTGNCVDMSLGVLNAAAMYGARGGTLRFGTWNGGPHVWAEVDGVTIDPARKALNGTFAAPARGPGGSGGGNTYVFQAPVYDWNAFKKQVAKANDKIIGGVF